MIFFFADVVTTEIVYSFNPRDCPEPVTSTTTRFSAMFRSPLSSSKREAIRELFLARRGGRTRRCQFVAGWRPPGVAQFSHHVLLEQVLRCQSSWEVCSGRCRASANAPRVFAPALASCNVTVLPPPNEKTCQPIRSWKIEGYCQKKKKDMADRIVIQWSDAHLPDYLMQSSIAFLRYTCSLYYVHICRKSVTWICVITAHTTYPHY
jgi:hypothetical protein